MRVICRDIIVGVVFGVEIVIGLGFIGIFAFYTLYAHRNTGWWIDVLGIALMVAALFQVINYAMKSIGQLKQSST